MWKQFMVSVLFSGMSTLHSLEWFSDNNRITVGGILDYDTVTGSFSIPHPILMTGESLSISEALVSAKLSIKGGMKKMFFLGLALYTGYNCIKGLLRTMKR